MSILKDIVDALMPKAKAEATLETKVVNKEQKPNPPVNGDEPLIGK